jgi:hypothetical protein
MNKQQQQAWASGTWLGAEQLRRAADAQLTFRQKLEWNAQALRLAQQFKQGRVAKL